MDGGEQFVRCQQVLAIAGVEILQRHASLATHAGQCDVGAQRNQQRHGVANRRAIGHVAAQRAGVAHRHARKARGKAVQLRPVVLQRVEGVGE
ncbi:hypothetical protein SDC9_201990 [bioreactor metagenome]|uniref:Uncharacterized protein n=1 Tax=bioreactor metagenome TaxID=1076179 RepID=A0A645ITV4_9ZZZZ